MPITLLRIIPVETLKAVGMILMSYKTFLTIFRQSPMFGQEREKLPSTMKCKFSIGLKKLPAI